MLTLLGAFIHLQENYQLCEAFLRVAFTNCDTIEQNVGKCQLYEGKIGDRPLRGGRRQLTGPLPGPPEPHSAQAVWGIYIYIYTYIVVSANCRANQMQMQYV